MKHPYRQTIVHRLAAAATGLCMIPFTIAETLPNPGVADARIRTSAYSQDEVYRLTGYVGYQTDLEFQQGETVLGSQPAISKGSPSSRRIIISF